MNSDYTPSPTWWAYFPKFQRLRNRIRVCLFKLRWRLAVLLYGRRRLGSDPKDTLDHRSTSFLGCAGAYRLDPWTCVKFCYASESEPPPLEALNMTFVRRHTNIPLPTVHSFFEIGVVETFSHRRRQYALIMEFMQGQVLQHARKNLSNLQLKNITQQLRTHIHSLRSIPRFTSAAVCSIVGSRCHDTRLDGTFLPLEVEFGPFHSVSAFHDYIFERATWAMKASKYPIPEEAFKARETFPDDAKVVLSHGDLSPHNILVDGDGNVVGVIDWENFGFWPEWWEYQRAMYYWYGVRGYWDKIFNNIFQDYRKETEAYGVMQSYAGGIYI
ncbi:kinase-like protein [Atractiella rhizophila]|nr:kinase-like protein [Atractiella rhizophila]